MTQGRKIKNALISVFHKDGLSPIIKKLDKLGVEIYSTGGTQNFIEGEGIKVNKVEDLTTYPSILGGRVKTLHPNVFGGILARRELDSDKEQLNQYNIPEFDLVIVDLYPFEKTVQSGAIEKDIIEKIDIGGISLIRAAAKNYKDVLIVSEMNQYSEVLNILENESIDQQLMFDQQLNNRFNFIKAKLFGFTENENHTLNDYLENDYYEYDTTNG